MGLFTKRPQAATDGGAARDALLPDGTRVVVKRTVDCMGDSCPRPQLMTKKALAAATPGDVIEVLIDNPTSMEAIPPMMPVLGSTHLATVRAERCWRVFVRKG